MTILLQEISKQPTGTYITLSGEKQTAFVGITAHGVQVTCMNAAHRAWKGAGRCFANMQDAIAGYKSGEMKELIRAAGEHAAPVNG